MSLRMAAGSSVRIVAGEHHVVAHVGGDLGHLRALALVAVASAANDRDNALISLPKSLQSA